MVKALPFIHQPDRVERKPSDVSAADWRYQTRVKKHVFFHVCYYGISQGWKSLNNTVGYMIKEFIVLSDIHIRWKKKSWLVLVGVKPRTFP